MMASWTVAGWAGHKCFTKPATLAIFQSQDERRALKDIKYAKILWRNTIPALRSRWPVKTDVDKQAEHKFEMANGSAMIAIPRDPDALRSEHPSIVVFDEAAFMERAEECYNTALGSKPLHIIALSSANPGWMADLTEFAQPAAWPGYPEV